MRQMLQREVLSEVVYNFYIVFALVFFIMIGFKRLQDAGYSGFLFFVPFVNLILAGFPSKKNN